MAAQLPDFAAKDEQNQDKLIAAILRWLEQCPHPWLLIVDNADDLVLVQPYLPMQGSGSILLTTRTHAVAALGNALEVVQMGLVEGTHFLLHRSQRPHATEEERNEASNLSGSLLPAAQQNFTWCNNTSMIASAQPWPSLVPRW